jgi:hypothetical protein
MGNPRFHFFGSRLGRHAAINVFRAALERAMSDDPQILKNLTRALMFTGFDPVVGLSIKDVNLDNFHLAADELRLDEADKLETALRRWVTRGHNCDLIRFSLTNFSFEELDTLSFAILARYDKLLYKHGIISHFDYFLFRGEQTIHLLDACSGELCFITTVAFIASRIKNGTVIAIDEPETSLHPTWQKDYAQTLLDLFYHYQPRIIIATHSPIIISGAESKRDNFASSEVFVYEMKDGMTSKFEHAQLSLEEMYDRLFGLITPKNHYLSQRAVSLLNALSNGDRNLNQVVGELEELRAKSYDEPQKNVIAKVEDMARQVEIIKQRKDLV